MQVPQQVKDAPTWAKALVMGGLCLVVAPALFFVLKGIAVALAITAAGGIILVAINFGPVFAEKLANAGLEARKNEWKESPVPTLQLLYVAKAEELQKKKVTLEETVAAVADFRTLSRRFAAKFPSNKDKISNYEVQLGRLVLVENDQKAKFQAAVQSLEVFNSKIEEAEAEWEVIVALRKANKSAMVGQDPMTVLKERIAFGSVETNMNKCFAALETSLLTAPKYDELQVDGVTLQIPQKEKVT